MPRLRKWLPLAAAIALVAAGSVALFTSGIRWDDVVAFLNRLSPALLLPLMAILPVFGFSVGAVYLLAGAKFGLVLGGIVVAAVTAIHLLLTHAIAHSFRGPIDRLLERHRHHLPVIPQGAGIAIAAMIVLVPGIPYFARNFLLAISGIPLRIYFAVCVPLYVVRSYLTIYIGNFGMKPNTHQLVIIGIIAVLKLGVCALILQYLRKRYYRPAPAAKASAK